MNVIGLLRLLALERFGRDTLERAPEPSLVMDAHETVEVFDRQGRPEGPLVPLYHFLALALSRLLPEDGHLLDLGSGSGRLLSYLAAGRPDVDIVGLELSPMMVQAGNAMLRANGQYPRVRLQVGDMTNLRDQSPTGISAVSINLALEHLADWRAVEAFAGDVAGIVSHTGCAFWAFNHSRPKSLAVAELFPEVFTPLAPLAFREDSRNSLVASWRFSELLPLFRATIGAAVRGRLSRLLPLYQAFWLVGAEGEASTRPLWQGTAAPAGAAGREFRLFRTLLFPDVPLDTARVAAKH